MEQPLTPFDPTRKTDESRLNAVTSYALGLSEHVRANKPKPKGEALTRMARSANRAWVRRTR